MRSGSDRPGAQAPAFEGRSISGKKIQFPEDYRGRFVLLDFWATWCGPCRQELPHVRKALERFGERGFAVLGVTLDAPQVEQSRVSRFVADERMPWPQVYDDAIAIAGKYGVEGIPAAFLVDGTGKIVAQGDALRGDELLATLERTLTKQ